MPKMPYARFTIAMPMSARPARGFVVDAVPTRATVLTIAPAGYPDTNSLLCLREHALVGSLRQAPLAGVTTFLLVVPEEEDRFLTPSFPWASDLPRHPVDTVTDANLLALSLPSTATRTGSCPCLLQGMSPLLPRQTDVRDTLENPDAPDTWWEELWRADDVPSSLVLGGVMRASFMIG